MRIVLLALGVLSVAGCARPQVFMRWPPGGTEARWQRDDYECRRENSMVVVDQYAYVSQSRLAVDPPMYYRCMAARGYQKEERPR